MVAEKLDIRHRKYLPSSPPNSWGESRSYGFRVFMATTPILVNLYNARWPGMGRKLNLNARPASTKFSNNARDDLVESNGCHDYAIGRDN
jgi:hypothetical protein